MGYSITTPIGTCSSSPLKGERGLGGEGVLPMHRGLGGEGVTHTAALPPTRVHLHLLHLPTTTLPGCLRTCPHRLANM